MTNPVSPAAIALVQHFEGLRLTAYLCPAGVPTIGYGHTAGVKMGQTITAAQADAFLSVDLAAAAAQVDRLVRVPLTDDQRGALSSFVFNLGPGSLQSSTLLKLLNARDYDGAVIQFGRWVYAKVNGVSTRLPGLVARRAAEAALFSGQTAQAQGSICTCDGNG
ncbi:lysozyme (plasmid) [Azospirillum sp. HJ39]|uniref:lysozyme n=1 Tax=Azospirillum sp. HJ39 TaxID=3159496 RepID=UPI0035586AD7